MKPLILPLLAASIVLSSCATYSLTPQADSDQKIRRDRGNPVVSAVKDNIGVAVSTEVNGSHIYFKLYVKNYRTDLLSVDDSTARLEEGGSPLKVFRAEEYYKMRHDQIVAGEVLMAISAAMSTANAGYSTTTTYGRYSRTDFYHHSYGSYTSTTTTYDPSAAALQRDIAFSNVAQYAQGGKAELDFLKSALFYPSDIEANNEYYGIIVADFGERGSTVMRLTVSFDNTPFSFTFNKEQD